MRSSQSEKNCTFERFYDQIPLEILWNYFKIPWNSCCVSSFCSCFLSACFVQESSGTCIDCVSKHPCSLVVFCLPISFGESLGIPSDSFWIPTEFLWTSWGNGIPFEFLTFPWDSSEILWNSLEFLSNSLDSLINFFGGTPLN